MRGWLAASVCTWTAFAAHAHAAPTAASVKVMLLITCVSAVIAMALLGRKFTLLATSLVVLGSQGLYHLALAVMTDHGSTLSASTGTGIHAGHVTSLEVADTALALESAPMLWAHLGAAFVSIFVLRQGEQLVKSASETLSLAAVRRLLAGLRIEVPLWPRADGILTHDAPLRSHNDHRLPLLRGPPSAVLNFA